MQAEPLTPQEEFKEALENERNTMRKWAMQREIPPQTLYTVLRRWGKRRDRPLGGISREVMQKIATYVAQQPTQLEENDHEPT